jgi:dTDP-4-amino-4,6-dideoxygalactose transaminase
MAALAINGGEKVRTEGWPSWPPDDPGFLENLKKVLDSRVWGTGGAFREQAERAMAEFHGAEFAVAVTSGTAALEVPLRVLGVGVGDEVIVPPYTFVATATSVVAVGGVPVFVDIDPETCNLDPTKIEEAITEYTKAIIPVHIGGSPADLDPIIEIGKKHGLAVIEDACQAHGAEYKGRKVGAIADAGAFSFQSSKNVCAGEGGMILTNNREVYEKAWSLANIGRVPEGGWYDHRVMGWNLRLTEFQSALVVRGMELLPEHFELRYNNGERLRQRLEEIEGVSLQKMTHPSNRSAYHLYIFSYDREAFDGLPREKFLQALHAEGIGGGSGYNPLYREGLFKDNWDPNAFPFAPQYYEGKVNYNEVACPACEYVCDEAGFWMGQSTGLADEQAMDDIADAMLKVQQNVGEIERTAEAGG